MRRLHPPPRRSPTKKIRVDSLRGLEETVENELTVDDGGGILEYEDEDGDWMELWDPEDWEGLASVSSAA